MPVDPRIFENLKFPTAREPLKMFEDIARLKALESESQTRQSDAQVRQLQARLAQQKFDTEQQEMQAVQQVWEQAGGDPLKAIGLMHKVNPKLAIDMTKEFYAAQKQQQDFEQVPKEFDLKTRQVNAQIESNQLMRDQQAQNAADLHDYRQWQMNKPPSESAGSDYGRFEADYLAAEAAKRNKALTALTPPEIVQIKIAARKAYGQADDAARRPLAPIVIQTGQGPMITTGPDRNAVQPILGPDGKPLGQAPTAEMRNREAAKKLVGTSISAIKEIGDTIITRVGPAQRLDALKRGAETVFGNDPDFRTYQDARMALAGNLAVGQQGSRPSDADIKAIWLPLVPNPYTDTKESAAMKWELIRTMSGVPPNNGAAASNDKSVTMTELAALAKRKGTTVEQETQRATAAGYVVR